MYEPVLAEQEDEAEEVELEFGDEKKEAEALQRGVLRLFVCIGTVTILSLGQSLLMPVAIAALIAFFLHPQVVAIERRGVPRVLAAILAELVLFAFISSAIWLAAVQTQDLVQSSPDLIERLIQRVSGPLRMVRQLLNSYSKDEISIPPMMIAENFAFPLLNSLLTLLLIFIVSFLFVLHWHDIIDRVFAFAGESRLLSTIRVVDAASRGVRRFLFLDFLCNLVFAALFSGILFLFGIPQSLLWGMLSILWRFIPTIGLPASLLPPLLLSVAVHPSWVTSVELAFCVITVHSIFSQLIEPYVYGRGIGVSAIGLVLSALFWAWCWGAVGLLISTPMAVCLVVLGRFIPAFEVFPLLFGRGGTSQHALRFARVLFSGDLERAKTVLASVRKSSGAEGVYDHLFLPTILLAEEEKRQGTLSPEVFEVFLHSFRDTVLPEAKEKARTSPITLGESGVLVVPVREDSELCIGELLAHSLEGRGVPVEVLSPDALASEVVGKIIERGPKKIVLIAIGESSSALLHYILVKLQERNYTSADVFLLSFGEGRWGRRLSAGVNVRLHRVRSYRDTLQKLQTH